MPHIDKQKILSLIISKLEEDIDIAAQAVAVARDTATHKDCLGSSKYETMGLEASYLAQGQGTRLIELERALSYFKQVQLTPHQNSVVLSTLVTLDDEAGKRQYLWLAVDAGGLKIPYSEAITITVITAKSPLGRALIGRHKGDTFELKLGKSLQCYEVSSIT